MNAEESPPLNVRLLLADVPTRVATSRRRVNDAERLARTAKHDARSWWDWPRQQALRASLASQRELLADLRAGWVYAHLNQGARLEDTGSSGLEER